MNTRLLSSISLLLICILGVQNQFLFAQSPKPFAVIELFTSEGCSSCPAAENVLMDIEKEKNKDVYILEFHVDYWDNLGWKDPFSAEANSERQRAYSRTLALQSIYTPQAIVNGSMELVGSDKARLQKVIGDELMKSQSSNITIRTKPGDGHSYNIFYRIDGKTNDLLNFALVQTEANTDVKRGENKGRQLHHIQIVRAFKTIESPGETGNILLSIPTELTPENFRVLAFLQDKKNLHIKGVAQSDRLY